MKLLTIISLLTSASALAVRAPAAWSNYVKNGVFYPLQNATSWRTVYGRSLQLADKSILVSWEDYDPRVEKTYWPIWRSTDGGASFTELSRVQDQVNGWGNWYQPFLYTLPQDIGTFKKGTILLAGTSTPRDLSQAYIDIYASTDAGKTWKFVSHVVYGPGPETIRNGDKAVWEPFLMIYKNQLVCYYSTQVDPNHGQKLSHKTTTNLLNWSAEVDDVAQPNYYDRPGMTTVAYSPKSKKYVMTFEYCGSSFAGGCPVHYKVASNPLQFQSVQPAPILPNDPNGNPNGSPYVIWTNADPSGAGVFIMNGNSREEVFVNTNAVDPNGWKPVNINHWSAYSRGLEIVTTPSNTKKLFVINGGNIGCEGSCYNYVADALVDVPGYPA